MDQSQHIDNPDDSKIASLLGPNLPADRGLTGLGLIMQLAGSVLLAYGAMITIMALWTPAYPGSPRLSMIMIGILCGVRSVFHRSAGTGLLYNSPQGHLHALKRYIIVGMAQSVAVFLLLKNMEVPTDMALYLLIMLIAWPAALAVMTMLPQFKSIERDVPDAEDMGFESAAVLMTIMGIAGSLIMAILIFSMMKSDALRSEVPGIMALLVCGMLLVRSILHSRAGLQGISGVNPDRATETANRYVQFGITSAILTGAVLLLQILMESQRMGIQVLIPVVGLSYLLITWPTILRNFFTDRNFSLILDEEKTTRRAPDRGLTALGWLLFAFGTFGLGNALASFLIEGGTRSLSMAPMLSELTGPGEHSPIWSVALCGLQIFAGFTLIGMRPNYKLIVTAYGAVSSLATLYLFWPLISQLKGNVANPIMMPFVYGSLVLGLSVSVGAILLVNRQESPDAQARIVA